MIQVGGHRGAAGLFPENTLKAFQGAFDLGVDYIECDIHLSRDGKVVVIHDDTVDRTTNGTGAIADLPYDEMRKFDAGDGEPIPLLADLLDCLRGRDVALFCEIKAEDVMAPAVKMVREAGLYDLVTFICFEMPWLWALHREYPGIRLGPLFRFPHEEHVEEALKMQPCNVGLYYRRLNLLLAGMIHDAGAELSVWTPDDPESFPLLKALGVDAITTDRPDRLISFLKGH